MNKTTEELNNLGEDIEESLFEGLNALNLVSFHTLTEKLRGCVQIYHDTGSVDAIQALTNEVKSMSLGLKTGGRKKKADKENEIVQKIISTKDDNTDSIAETETSVGRPRRKAFQDATEKVNNITTSWNSQMRQDSGPIKVKVEIDDAVVEHIKQEKDDMPPPAPPQKRGRKKKTDAVKTERASTRTTRTRTIKSMQVSDSERDVTGRTSTSDVMIVPENVDVISLDGDDEKKDQGDEQQEEAAMVTERHSSTESVASKRSRSPSADKKRVRPKRTKRKKSPPQKEPERSFYEDALNSAPAEPQQEIFTTPPSQKISMGDKEVVMQQPMVIVSRLSKEVLEQYGSNANTTVTITRTAALNETRVIQKAATAVNDATFAVENPQILNSTHVIAKATVDDLMTDDDEDEEVLIRPKLLKAKQVNKQLFNPFENSPVKKKVEAFEKLGAQTGTNTTTRSTRTKTRQKAKDAADEDAKLQQELVSPKKAEQPFEGKKQVTTPQAAQRYIPTFTSGSKSNQLVLSDSVAKTLSSIKLSNQQFREREQRRKEKEAEAMKKKEAFLQKQSDEKRRKREEKELKAKLQREVLDKEKLRIVEQQKLKDEKQKQVMLEKLERQQKQREETERRRIVAKQKHDELKREEERKRAEEVRLQRKREEDEKRRIEEEKRMHELKAKQNEKDVDKMAAMMMNSQSKVVIAKEHLPIYMVQRAPLLPTPDCYDSDDEAAPKRPELMPWNTREAMHENLRTMDYIDTKIRNTLFCLKPQTPNLLELFPNVDPKKLRRNSSAIWKQPPRFTMMPQLAEDF